MRIFCNYLCSPGTASAVFEFHESDSYIAFAVAVELLDLVLLSRHQRRDFAGQAILFGVTILFVNNGRSQRNSCSSEEQQARPCPSRNPKCHSG